ncbi:hypothetical protein Erwinia_phage_Rouille_00112 [Erwinia phage Rouille]|nr:hypothetical protein Erwinia_phage_Rouille_00112 [Erwinia phage Rouille]
MNTPFIVNAKQRAILADNSFNPSISKEGKNIREGVTIQKFLNRMGIYCEGLNLQSEIYLEAREYSQSRDVYGNRTAHYCVTVMIDDKKAGKYYHPFDIVGSGSRRQQVGYGKDNGDITYSLEKLGYPVELVQRYEETSGAIRYTYRLKSLENLQKVVDAANGNLYYSATVEGYEIKAPLFSLIELKIKNLVSRKRDSSRKFTVTVSRHKGDKVSKVTRLNY